jgi:polar amino acid transport system permease protein
MSAGQAMRKVVLPQAFRMMLPPLTNELILVIKDSSLVYIIGVGATNYELTKLGRELSNSNANVTPLVVAGFFYLIITLPLSVLVRRMEARAARAR